MKRTLLTLAVASLAICLHASDFPAGSPPFTTNATKVMAAAKENGKPTILVFSASWCGPCQAMKKDVYPSDEVKPFADKFNWAYLDIDDEANSKLSDSYKVESIPHIMFLNAEGKTIDQQEGSSSPKDFAKKLEKVLKKAGTPKTASVR